MIPQHEVAALLALILRLESARPLTPEEAWRKGKLRRARLVEGETLDDFELRLKEPAPTTPYLPRLKEHPIYGNTEHALGYHVAGLNGHFDDWFAWAHPLPPHSASRIKAILKRAKMTDLRERFMAAYEKHIPAPLTASYADPWPLPDDEDERDFCYLQSRVRSLIVRPTKIEDTARPGQFDVHVDFCCRECGGAIVHCPDDNDDDGPAICKACGIVFGTLWDVRALAQHMANMVVKS